MDVKDFNSRIIGLLIISIFITIMFLYKLIYLIPLIFIAVLMFQSNKKIFSYISRHTRQIQMYNIEDGVFYSEKKASAVLIIDDIQMDYKDFTNSNLKSYISSFYKILDIAKDINIVLKKESFDKNSYVESLSQKMQALRIMIDSDPSNEKAKRKLELMETIISRIESGENPFKYEMYIIVNSKDKNSALATASMIRQGLEGLGIKTRIATLNEIRELLKDFFRSKLNFNKIVLPTQIPYLTPISIEKKPNNGIIIDGILLGKDPNNNSLVFWNITKSQNTHLLIVGPTGSGKTEFLIWLSTLLNVIYGGTIILFDIKGDIKHRLSKYKVPFQLINPLFYRLGLLDEYEIPIKIKLLQIEKILLNSFRLSKFSSSILYTYLNRLIDTGYLKYRIMWKDLEKYLDELNDFQLKYYLGKLINILSSMEDSELPPLLHGISENEINVIDLTLIKSEEVKRLIIYSVLQEIYNKFSLEKIYDMSRVFLVLDEAWTILKNESEDYPIVVDLVKRGRGHGISIIMATQNLEDLGDLVNIYLDNIGVVVFMNNGDKKFWEEVRRFVNVDNDTLSNNLMFMGRGEALVRFLGDPRPIVIRLGNLASSTL
ncbi:AAA ATPase [Sulfolobus islandicus L.S.2.15]|uniref:AAA ATPase n=3 Tax=Saccharolobus islandicus TaxID=43080 RepID=C3MJ52_SACI2|nr:DNA import protein CedB [Sulfolobus islandicus]ACP36139.1 AAA ATPase [Sulfolobus islandicus L.S.2.15]ACP47934.1 AAA ATPase [Sulfolobus islandicus Y.N.15.51]ADB87894.1 AAA ATPase [Sulfolobus islandicus L.D.8.5]